MSFPERGMGAVHVFLYKFVIFFCVEVLGIFRSVFVFCGGETFTM